MAVTYDFGVLHLTNAVEELEQIALRRVERQIAHVKPGRRDFDRFWFTRRPRLLLALGAIPRRLVVVCSARRIFVSKKPNDLLPKRLFRRCLRGHALLTRPIIAAPSAGSAARTPAIPSWMRCHIDPQLLPDCVADEAPRNFADRTDSSDGEDLGHSSWHARFAKRAGAAQTSKQ